VKRLAFLGARGLLVAITYNAVQSAAYDAPGYRCMVGQCCFSVKFLFHASGCLRARELNESDQKGNQAA